MLDPLRSPRATGTAAERSDPAGRPVIRLEGISKAFGPTRALHDMHLSGAAGSVHAVLGENGAGKSTLMKILSGVIRPDAGRVVLAGEEVRLSSPQQARAAGISTIFQEFCLLPNLSVAENLFLGREPRAGARRSRAERDRRTRHVLARMSMSLDPDTPVAALGVGQQQMVEIAKGIAADARVFVFDEPTAALASHEARTLFALVEGLRDEGRTVFYVSHRLDEVFALCDTITVMKDGEHVLTVPAAKTTHAEVVEAMVGRPLSELFGRRDTCAGAPLLVADGLTAGGASAPLELSVARGEIVGIAGLEGQGQRELMRLLAGFTRATAGRLELDGRRVEQLGAPARLAAGLGFVPESRKEEGLLPSLDIRANMEIATVARRHPFAWTRGARARVAEVMGALGIRADSARQNVMALSGGNQQKVVLGRWLVADTVLLLCEEPTRGVDIGAKAEIYRRLRELAADGCGLLITSRELPELIGLCDRILVIRAGRIVAEREAEHCTEAELLQAALPPSVAAEKPAVDAGADRGALGVGS